jgi:hypothetical protein
VLHRSQIAPLEAGRYTPTLETLVCLARCLDLTLTVTVTPAGVALDVGSAPAAR